MIDEHTLQKLVDGELGNDQIRSLLRDADDAGGDGNQSLWKQMAVAFTENQLIQRSFGDFNAALDPARTSAEDYNSVNADSLNTTAADQKSALGSASRGAWAFVLAASLLIGAAILYQNAPSSEETLTRPSVAKATSPNASDTNEVASPSQSDSKNEETLLPFDRRTLLALTPDHQLPPDQLPSAFGRKGLQEVPLYDAKRFDRQQLSQLQSNDRAAKHAWFDQVIPNGSVNDEMVADYEKAGMLVDQDIEFLSGRLDDGRAYMIPYRSVRFIPGQ